MCRHRTVATVPEFWVVIAINVAGKHPNENNDSNKTIGSLV